jgi:hypothetical protein
MEKRLTATAACWVDVADTLDNFDAAGDFCRMIRAQVDDVEGYREVALTVPGHLVPAFDEALEILAYEDEFEPAG